MSSTEKYTQADLELAICHVKEAEQRIAEQRARIARLRDQNQATAFAEDLLARRQQSLELMKAHLATMIDPAKRD